VATKKDHQQDNPLQQWIRRLTLSHSASRFQSSTLNLAGFFQKALRLARADSGECQEVVRKLAGEGGLQK